MLSQRSQGNNFPFALQKGATLIEVMVAVLVLGIGLLGILSLQGRSLQYSQQAYSYSQATILSQDIAERIRANPDEDARERYQINFGADANAATDCSQATCTTIQMARWDLSTWQDDVEELLPNAETQIEEIDDNVYLIQILYEVDREGDDGREVYQLVIRL